MPAVSVATAIEPKQGELVFAFGSPGGLRNSVTMGVVSAVSRQADPSSPLVYIQTDTPINPGNSGGPLVDADGQLIGINTFIITSSGGNEGLGFAIPASLVSMVYPQLVKFGHIHQPEIGVTVQAITPELASALSLPRDFGLIVVDVQPGSPADHAGVKIQDVLTAVDGNLVASLPLLMHDLYMHKRGDHMKLAVLRGTQPLQFDIEVTEQPHNVDKLAELANSEKNVVKRLGILGVDLTPGDGANVAAAPHSIRRHRRRAHSGSQLRNSSRHRRRNPRREWKNNFESRRTSRRPQCGKKWQRNRCFKWNAIRN